MKRRLALALGVALLAFPLASSQQPAQPVPAQRTRCCHGCGSYGCNRKNCGDVCGGGPNCRGCWQGCAHISR